MEVHTQNKAVNCQTPPTICICCWTIFQWNNSYFAKFQLHISQISNSCANKSFPIGQHQTPGLSDCQSQSFNVCPTVRSWNFARFLLFSTEIIVISLIHFDFNFLKLLVFSAETWCSKSNIYSLFSIQRAGGNIQSAATHCFLSNLYSTMPWTHIQSFCLHIFNVREFCPKLNLHETHGFRTRPTPSFTRLLSISVSALAGASNPHPYPTTTSCSPAPFLVFFIGLKGWFAQKKVSRPPPPSTSTSFSKCDLKYN